jgi:hypothetical protein
LYSSPNVVCEVVDCIELAQDTDQQQVYVNTIINVWVPQQGIA